MCGFVGGTHASWDYGAALQTLGHRGPDAQKLQPGDPVSVGFCRLAIIDLDESANQPMASEDGSVWIVFNGEIYGFASLRRQLEGLGQRFRTRSDTEVVLRGYLQWGDDFVDRVDGMFAIAIWDARRRRLVLLRDRPGIKPLYYYDDGRHFAFASELKALERLCAGEGLRRDETALYDFLTYRYVPAPKTLYRECRKLPPAHRLVYDVDGARIESIAPFWRLEVPARPEGPPLAVACERLREVVDASVRDQIVADVPVGFFLSGGMDSSVVVASASRCTDRIETFSIGFDSDRDSETRHARRVARHFETTHHEKVLSRDASERLFERLRDWFDEPFGDTSAFPTFLVSAFARERVTVALTGDGGDEVFGGYRWYRRFERYAGLPSAGPGAGALLSLARRPFGRNGAAFRLLDRLDVALSEGVELYARLMKSPSAHEKKKWRDALGIDDDYDDYWFYRRFWREDLPVRTRLQYVDFHTFLPDDVLTKVDRVSMAVSLETRVPLLDRRVVEFAFALPESLRYYRGELKGLLKHAYRGILPDEILSRGKQGFSPPRRYLELARRSRQEHILFEHFADSLPEHRCRP